MHQVMAGLPRNIARPCMIATAMIVGSSAAMGADVNFDSQVRPIFSENCLRCHGPDTKSREAGLRFDRRDSAFEKLPSGDIAIVPGSSAKSELIRRVTSDD